MAEALVGQAETREHRHKGNVVGATLSVSRADTALQSTDEPKAPCNSPPHRRSRAGACNCYREIKSRYELLYRVDDE